MKVVLDTNAIVAGLRSRSGASFQLLRMIPQGNLEFLLSVPLVLEYEDVLKRPDNLRAFDLGQADIEHVLNMLCFAGTEISIHYLWRPKLSDPKDDMVLEVAVNGRADTIVTFNTAGFSAQSKQFGLRLMTPGEYLRFLK